MYSSPQLSLGAAVSQIKAWPGSSHVPANETDDRRGNIRMDSLIGELRKQTTELRQQGENIHQQMFHMYNVVKDIAKNHGKRSSMINSRFVDSLACDSEDYDSMDWKVLENRWKISQHNGTGSVDSGYKSDYPPLNDIISCPSYPKKPKILMGTKLIGWQKSRDNNSVHQQQSFSHLKRQNSDISTSLSSINEDQDLKEKATKEDSSLLSPPLRIVRFSDNVKTSKCKRIVPKYKKNRLSLKGTPAPSESFTSDYFEEDSKTHAYGKIVYYDLDRVEFLNTSLEEFQDDKDVVKDFKVPSPKSCYPKVNDNEQPNLTPRRVVNFKKPSAVKTTPNCSYKHTPKVDGACVNSVSSRQKKRELRHIDYDPHRRKDDISDSCHIYEEIIYDTKKEGQKPQVPPLPSRPKELCKNTRPISRDDSSKYYKHKSNLLWSVSNKMEKLAISNSQN